MWGAHVCTSISGCSARAANGLAGPKDCNIPDWLQRRSKAMFQSPEIQSIFKAAGLSLSVWETERPGHASEMVKQLDLAACDALVTVGGDGTVHEALQVCTVPHT